jgi:predicted kinase
MTLVVLLCGIAGSGKTTYAKDLEREGYVRLSVDEEIWRRWGRYAVDYPADRYPALSEQAESHVRRDLVTLVRAGWRVVVDLSLWRRATRDEYKALVEQAGGRWRLIHLRASPTVLHERLTARRVRGDANAFPVTEATLARYLREFEPPDGEGEEIIDAGD